MHCSTSYSSLYGYSCIRHGLQAVLHQMAITSAVCLLGVHLLERYAAAHIEVLSLAVPCIVPSIVVDQTWKSWTNAAGMQLWAGTHPGSCSLRNGRRAFPYLSTTIGTCKQTVPMAQLEQDWAEGSTEEEQPINPLA